MQGGRRHLTVHGIQERERRDRIFDIHPLSTINLITPLPHDDHDHLISYQLFHSTLQLSSVTLQSPFHSFVYLSTSVHHTRPSLWLGGHHAHHHFCRALSKAGIPPDSESHTSSYPYRSVLWSLPPHKTPRPTFFNTSLLILPPRTTPRPGQ